ncbi:MAG: transporter suffix domain-containing protein [Bacteroidales bacterium]|nr:transporter suffix domain-containing protein [Bacteroidales bacterium]
MQKNWKFKTGIFLIILSTLLFTSLLAVPFLDVAGKTKITISTIAVILGEITFWVGGILLGKELFNKYKSYLNPMNWFKKKTVPVPVKDSATSENTVCQTQEF